MGAMTQAMDMWSKPAAANMMTSGFKAIQDQAVKFAQQNTEAGFALAKDLAKAKDIQEVLALQTQYAQTQMQAYTQQAQVLGQLMAKAAQSANPNG
jgi:hypothetical protein